MRVDNIEAYSERYSYSAFSNIHTSLFLERMEPDTAQGAFPIQLDLHVGRRSSDRGHRSHGDIPSAVTGPVAPPECLSMAKALVAAVDSQSDWPST